MPRRIADFVIDPILRSSIRTVYLLWKPMAFWTILVYAAFTALLAPLVVNMVNRGVFRGDRLIVGNEELAAWFLSPSGFFYLFAIALITLTGTVIRFAGLYQIVSDDLKGDPINVKEIALHILQRIHVLVKLCIFSFFGSIMILLPLAAGLFAVYSIWLTEFDINYYISATPPEWTYALWAGGTWAALWALATLGLLAWSLPALPAYLDGRRTIWESLREAWTMPFPRMLRFLKIIAVLAGLWFLLRITTDAVLLFSFSFVADRLLADTESLRIIAFFTGSYFLFSFTIAAIISFFGFSLASTIITKFYYKDSPLNVQIVDPGFLKLAGKTFSFFTWWLTPAGSRSWSPCSWEAVLQ
jgi:glycerophosphoryl diester phosphodiesterase